MGIYPSEDESLSGGLNGPDKRRFPSQVPKVEIPSLVTFVADGTM